MTFLAKAGAWLGKNAMQLLGLGGNIGQSALDAKIRRENVDKTIAANKEMAEYQYSKDLEMWQRQNEYNSPIAQMERLKLGGLNPNLVYGQGVQGATGQAQQMPKYSAPRIDYNYKSPLNVAGTIQAFQDISMRNAQIDLVNEQKRVAEQNANNAGMYYRGRALGTSYKGDIAALQYITQSGKKGFYDFSRDKILRKNMPATRFYESQLQARQLQNDMIRKDLEYYLWNNVGSKVGSLIRSLSPGRIGKIGRGGMPKNYPKFK